MADINNNENTEEKIAKANDVSNITFIVNGEVATIVDYADSLPIPSKVAFEDENYNYIFFTWSTNEKYKYVYQTFDNYREDEIFCDFTADEIYYGIFIPTPKQKLIVSFKSSDNLETYSTLNYTVNAKDLNDMQYFYSCNKVIFPFRNITDTTLTKIQNDSMFISTNEGFEIGKKQFNEWTSSYYSKENYEQLSYDFEHFAISQLSSFLDYNFVPTYYSVEDDGFLDKNYFKEKIEDTCTASFNYSFYNYYTFNLYIDSELFQTVQKYSEYDVISWKFSGSKGESNYFLPEVEDKTFIGWCNDEETQNLIAEYEEKDYSITIPITEYINSKDILYTYNYTNNNGEEVSQNIYNYTICNLYAKFEDSTSKTTTTFISKGETVQQSDNITPPDIDSFNDDDYIYYFYGWSEKSKYKNADNVYSLNQYDIVNGYESGKTYYAAFVIFSRPTVNFNFYSENKSLYDSFEYKTTIEDYLQAIDMENHGETSNIQIGSEIGEEWDSKLAEKIKEIDGIDITSQDQVEGYVTINDQTYNIYSRYYDGWCETTTASETMFISLPNYDNIFIHYCEYLNFNLYDKIGFSDYGDLELNENDNYTFDIDCIINFYYNLNQYYCYSFYVNGDLYDQHFDYGYEMGSGDYIPEYTVINPTKDGKTFLGWTNSEDSNNVTVEVCEDCDSITVISYQGEFITTDTIYTYNYYDGYGMECEQDFYCNTYNFYAVFEEYNTTKFIVDGDVAKKISEGEELTPPTIENSDIKTYYGYYSFFAGWTENEEYESAQISCDRAVLTNNRIENFEYGKTYYAMIDLIQQPTFNVYVYDTNNKLLKSKKNYTPTLEEIQQNGSFDIFNNDSNLDIENTNELVIENQKIIGTKQFVGYFSTDKYLYSNDSSSYIFEELPNEPIPFDDYCNTYYYGNEFTSLQSIYIDNRFADWDVFESNSEYNSGPYDGKSTINIKLYARTCVLPVFENKINFHIEDEIIEKYDYHSLDLYGSPQAYSDCDVEIESPIIDGKNFLGWCNDENLENVVVLANENSSLYVHAEDGYFSGIEHEENVYNFYAKFEINQGSIQWYVEDVLYQEDIIIFDNTPNELVTPPNGTPAKDDIIIDGKTISFKFEGWSLESRYSTPIDFTTAKIYKDKDLTFYAVFSSEINSTKINLELNALDGDYILAIGSSPMYNFDNVYSSNYEWEASTDKTSFKFKDDKYFTIENLTISTCTLSDVNNIIANGILTLKQDDLIYNYTLSISEAILAEYNEQTNPFYNLDIDFITIESESKEEVDKPAFYKDKQLEISLSMEGKFIIEPVIYNDLDRVVEFISGFIDDKYTIETETYLNKTLNQGVIYEIIRYTYTTYKKEEYEYIGVLNTSTNRYKGFEITHPNDVETITIRAEGAHGNTLDWLLSRDTISDFRVVSGSAFIYNPTDADLPINKIEKLNCIVSNSNFNSNNSATDGTTMAVKNFTYKEYEKQYTFTFYDDINGKSLGTVTKAESQKLSSEDYSFFVPTKAETERVKYDFDYWYYLKDNEKIKIDDETIFDSDKDIYPEYKETNIYYVYFLDNEHSFKKYEKEKLTTNDLNSDTFTEVNNINATTEFTTYTRKFVGWSTNKCLDYDFIFDANLYHYDYNEGETFSIETDKFCITVSNNRTNNPYADYEIKEDLWFYPVYLYENFPLYTIQFKNSDGSRISTQIIKQGSKLTSIPSLAKTKETNKYTYSFIGWSTDKRNTTEIVNPPTQDATYYALYKITSKKEQTTTTTVSVETPVAESDPTYKDPNTLIGHLLRFEDKQDLIDFLLELYIDDADKQFGNWRCVKFEMSTTKTDLVVNPIYNEFNTDYYIKFNSSSDLNCLLGVSSATDKGKILQTYNAINSSSYLANRSKITQILPYDIFKSFNNSYPRAEFDVKLMYPSEQKIVFDKDDQYESFYIDFYSKDNEDHGIIFSYSENSIDSDIQPAIDWITFCYDKYSKFMKAKYYSNRFSLSDYV
jgi:hypothetical protein